MALHPLTHHELLALVEPFSRSGWQLDLAATDRAARRLVFKPREHPAAAPLGRGFQEGLVLEQSESGAYRLIRTLAPGAGPEASVRAEGAEPGALLERLGRVAPEVLIQVRPTVTVLRSYRVIPHPQPGPAGKAPDLLALTTAAAEVGGVRFTLDAGTGAGGWPAEVLLAPLPGRPFEPPEDLLAVLGRGWRPLRRIPQGWQTRLRLPKREPQRTRDCEAKLALVMDHLGATLGQPPARYHARFRAARWGLVGRRLAGLAAVAGLLVAGPLILYLDLPQGSAWRLVAFNMPNVLLLGLFLSREIPVLRWPRPPRPLSDRAWSPGAVAGADAPALSLHPVNRPSQTE